VAFIDAAIDQARPGGQRMLELGDQVILDAPDLPPTGKAYYTSRGFTHTSVDLNGAHGSLRHNLAKPMPHTWDGQFDVVTNAGTTEHVEPFTAQYTCFESLHRVLAVGGVAVHIVPDVDELDQRGAWKWHSNQYYSHAFFHMLADQNGYRLIASTILIGGHRCAALHKVADQPFMTDRRMFLSQVARRPGGQIYYGINGGLLAKIYHRLYRTLHR